MPITANLIEDFLRYMEQNKRMSRHTILAYRNDLIAFQNYLNDENNLLITWKASHIRGWVSQMLEDHFTEKSIHRKISTLRSFLKYARRQGLLQSDPMAKVTLPKIPRKIVQDIPAKDLTAMFARFPWEEYENGYRDRLILLTFYTTGIRLSELIGIKLSDVDFQRGTISINGKRNKQRILPLHSELLHHMQEYVSENAKSNILFCTDQGKPVYPMFIYRLVTKYLQLFSTALKTSPHVLRHSFATHLLHNGANLMAIKELLGHASLSATQVYTKNSFEKLKSIHRLHPRE